ncbi:MAG: hypothetical protein EYC67_09505 [Betaproteobacteria bacterium]|nr:MAG: hypothetical protein EYC67_09505 [Betaproteobacteria bacterium]
MPTHRSPPFLRSGLTPTALAAGLAWAGALTVVACSGIAATRLFAPIPAARAAEAVAPADARTHAEDIVRAGLFAGPASHSGSDASNAGDALNHLQLTGVATGFAGGGAFALVSTDGRTATLRVGETLAGGWEVAAIQPDRLELRAGERRAELVLRRATVPTARPGPAPDTAARDDAPAPNED